jgi:hypothetical protein
MNALLELLKLTIVGLVSSFFSYYLAGRKHRSEKWWELRVASYQEVISALSDLYYYFSQHLQIEEHARDVPEETMKEIDRFFDDSYHKVRKAADAGAFLFSTEADAALKKFIKDDTHYDSSWDYLYCNCAQVKTCLDVLVACSKVDLRLKGGFFTGWFNRP